MNWIDFLTAIFGTGFLGAVIGWIVERKKNNALTSQEISKAKQNEADATKSIQDAYADFAIMHKEEYKELLEKYTNISIDRQQLKNSNDLLIKELEKLKQDITTIKKTLISETKKREQLTKEYYTMKTNYDTLKKDYDILKKEYDTIVKKI